MKFALKKMDGDYQGFLLCNAETGEELPGQVRVKVTCSPDTGYRTEVRLHLFGLPLFEN